MSVKSVVKLLVPPLVVLAFKKLAGVTRSAPGPDVLFDGDDAMFKRTVAASRNYGEYGCGTSTIWVAAHTSATIHSVDTSAEWIQRVRMSIQDRPAELQWVDCGPVGDWGTPLDFDKRENFSAYARSLWIDGASHDTVLIDGRFRVLCFLTSLKHAAAGTRLIFDDYTNRPHYHIVEELLARSETCGRQCMFVVPQKAAIDADKLEAMLDKFEYVMN